MDVAFTKMSGAGNDFIFLGPSYSDLIALGNDLAKVLCQRRKSIGADGLIFVEDAEVPRMHYFNRDDSRASFCGNGARCFILYCITKGISQNPFRFQSDAGLHLGKLTDEGPFLSLPLPKIVRKIVLSIDGETLEAALIEAGVPHAVVKVNDVGEIDVPRIGRKIRFDENFSPEGANVDFVEVVDERQARVRTYERGVEGETLACGSGCVAVGYLLWKQGTMSRKIRLQVTSGDVLTVEVDEREIFLGGPAEIVYEGNVDIKEMGNV